MDTSRKLVSDLAAFQGPCSADGCFYPIEVFEETSNCWRTSSLIRWSSRQEVPAKLEMAPERVLQAPMEGFKLKLLPRSSQCCNSSVARFMILVNSFPPRLWSTCASSLQTKCGTVFVVFRKTKSGWKLCKSGFHSSLPKLSPCIGHAYCTARLKIS